VTFGTLDETHLGLIHRSPPWGAVEIVSQLQLGRPHALSADRAGQYCVDFDGPMCLLEIRDAHG